MWQKVWKASQQAKKVKMGVERIWVKRQIEYYLPYLESYSIFIHEICCEFVSFFPGPKTHEGSPTPVPKI